MLNGYNFWQNIDGLNPYPSAKALASAAGINYRHMVQQRADSTVPKAEDLLKLSSALNQSIESLLTGHREKIFSKRVERIALSCQKAEEIELQMVERILGIRSVGENHTVSSKMA